ncbi:MAG: helix-turn-helix transcriptional regulator, partial [Pseudomonadota bacterium]
MAGEKVFIGPRLRELRQGQDHTQAQMAAALGVSASYINLIERNQRSASLRFLIALSDTYGVDWRQMTSNSNSLAVADLRQLFRDP